MDDYDTDDAAADDMGESKEYDKMERWVHGWVPTAMMTMMTASMVLMMSINPKTEEAEEGNGVWEG